MRLVRKAPTQNAAYFYLILIKQFLGISPTTISLIKFVYQ